MTVDPNIAAQAAAMTVTAPAGGSSALEAGKSIVARVLDVSSSGAARISIAGHAIAVQTTAPITPGQVLSLTVGAVADGQVRLTINDPAAAAPSAAVAAAAQAEVNLLTSSGTGSSSATGGSGNFASLAPRAISELARAGVAVTPELVQAVAKAVEQFTAAEASLAGNAGSATRAVAELAARGLTLDQAAASRVAAALDLSGKLGTSLTALAAKSPDIAAALPAGAPNSAALRSLLASSLTPVELAIARVAQAVEAARSVQQSTVGRTHHAAHTQVVEPQRDRQLRRLADRRDRAAR